MASPRTQNPYLMSGYGGLGIQFGRPKPQLSGYGSSPGTNLALQVRSQKGYGK